MSPLILTFNYTAAQPPSPLILPILRPFYWAASLLENPVLGSTARHLFRLAKTAKQAKLAIPRMQAHAHRRKQSRSQPDRVL